MTHDDDQTAHQDELESQDGQPLPSREVMSVITPGDGSIVDLGDGCEPVPEKGSEPDSIREPLRGPESL